MGDIDESTDAIRSNTGGTDEMTSSEPLLDSEEIPHDKPPQRNPWADDPPTFTPQKPRRNIWKPLAIALALLVAASGGWYMFVFVKTPGYAFKQIKKAYDTHDVELFNQYVDADAFCQQTVDDYLTWVDQNDLAGTATDLWSELGKTIAQSMIQTMKPQMVADMKKNLLNSVEDTDATFASSTFSLKNDIVSLANPKCFINETPIAAVKSGKVTTLTFTAYDSRYSQNLKIDLLLRDTGRHLQVVRMANFAEWLNSINKAEQALVDLRNQQEKTNMENTIDVATCQWEWNSWASYIDMTISTSIKNLGSKSIDKYGLTLTFSDSSGKKITDVDFGRNSLIKAKSSLAVTSDLSFNLNDSDDKKVFDSMKKDGNTFTVNYSYIHFTDATEYKLHKKFE